MKLLSKVLSAKNETSWLRKLSSDRCPPSPLTPFSISSPPVTGLSPQRAPPPPLLFIETSKLPVIPPRPLLHRPSSPHPALDPDPRPLLRR
jgi:hypothetical protein